jgi:hypothetical protein
VRGSGVCNGELQGGSIGFLVRLGVVVLSDGGLPGKFGVSDLLLQVRVAEFDDDGVRFDDRAGLQIPLDAACGGGRNRPDFFGLEGAGASDLTDHRAPLDRSEVHGAASNRGGGRFELGNEGGNTSDGDDPDYREQHPSLLLFLQNRGIALNIHCHY